MTTHRRKAAVRASSDTRPTHMLKMKPLSRKRFGWSTVGAAWVNETEDSVKIKLNRGVVLDWHDFEPTNDAAGEPASPEFVLMLFPADPAD